MGVEYTLNTRGLDRLIARFPDRVDVFVRAVAFKLVAAIMRRAKVDTGFMRASVYAATRGLNGRIEAQKAAFSAAKSAGKRRTINQFSGGVGKVEPGEAVVTMGAAYAIYVENKTPFFGPAVKEVESELLTMLNDLAAKLQGDAG